MKRLLVTFSQRGNLVVTPWMAFDPRDPIWVSEVKQRTEEYGEGKVPPIVSVELTSKWYGLQLIHVGLDPTGTMITTHVEEVPFTVLNSFAPEGHSPFVDHVPNPSAVAKWAEANDYSIGDMALELMVGRWTIEVTHMGCVMECLP